MGYNGGFIFIQVWEGDFLPSSNHLLRPEAISCPNPKSMWAPEVSQPPCLEVRKEICGILLGTNL